MSRSPAMRDAGAARSMSVWIILLAASSLAGPLPSARAAFTTSGWVSPSSDPSTWDSSTTCIIGGGISGTLTVDGGSGLLSSYGYVGWGGSSTNGLVTISGSGSTWTNGNDIMVGGGSGTLNITNGGAVTSNNEFMVGYYSGGSGTLNITGGGTLSDAYGSIGYYNGSSGTVTVDGAGSKWSSSNNFFNNGGPLTITNGGAVDNVSGFIGNNSGASGTVTVDGAGSKWTNSGKLDVGCAGDGTGTLNIINGGSVSAAMATYVGRATSSTGAVNFGTSGGTLTTQSLYVSPTQLTGTGTIIARGLVSDVNLVFDSTHGLSQTVPGFGSVAVNLDMSDSSNVGDLGAGWNGAGSLTIQDGIAVTSSYGYVGYFSGSTGTATISGAGSNWTISTYLYVGYAGKGTLNITNGGTVSNTYASYVGNGGSSSGTVTVDGAGSTWTNGILCVGYSGGSGTLNINNGGAVSNTYGSIGNSNFTTGTVTVDGTGSTWTNSGSLNVGYSGTGTVTQTGGTNSVAGTLSLGYNSTGKGTYNLNGGVLALHALRKGSGSATFNFGGGILRADTTFSSALPMTLTGAGGNATVNTQNYAVTLSGNLSGSGGLTKCGAGALTLSAANNYNGTTTVAGGTLELGTVAARHPVFDLGGADIQSGKMVFAYTGGSSPAATIQGLLAASYDGGLWDVGQFRNSMVATTGLTLGWLDDPVTQTVTVMATYAGDFNLDGQATPADYLVWWANNGKGPSPWMSWADGDANYDGEITPADYLIWWANNGRSVYPGPVVGGSSGAGAVPEPGTLVLLAAGLIGLLVYVRQTKK
jgi:T5SS/PEP-CTERM-associated repeat protein